LHRQIYNSKALTAWFAVFIACEVGFAYFFILALSAHHRRAAASIIMLDVVFAASVLFMSRSLSKTFGFRYETDGATWIRRFGQGHEQRITKDTVSAVRREGLAIVLVSADQELPITRDCWGYEKLRDIAEEWARALEKKPQASSSQAEVDTRS
jgi:hypothetical protein